MKEGYRSGRRAGEQGSWGPRLEVSPFTMQDVSAVTALRKGWVSKIILFFGNKCNSMEAHSQATYVDACLLSTHFSALLTML